MALDVSEFQSAHADWISHNFPNQESMDGFLGLVEELGELAHTILKAKQGIYGRTDEQVEDAVVDAIGDIYIFLNSFCTTNGYDLETCILRAWNEVKDRDFQLYPVTGRPPKAVSS